LTERAKFQALTRKGNCWFLKKCHQCGQQSRITYCRMIIYRHKFLTKDEFDNCYVNKMLAEIDIQRDGMDRPTILPLLPNETKKFIKVCKMTKIYKYRKKKIFLITELYTEFTYLIRFSIKKCFVKVKNVLQSNFIQYSNNGPFHWTGLTRIYRIRFSTYKNLG